MSRTTVLRAAATALLVASAMIAPAIPASAAPPPDAGQAGAPVRTSIVYATYDPGVGSMSLWVTDPQGHRTRQLTSAPSGTFDTHAVRSHDGSRVVFMRESDAGVQIGVVRVAEPQSLTWIDTGCAAIPDCEVDINPTWSLDDSRLYFNRIMGPFDEWGTAASAALYSTRLDGSDLRRVSPEDLPWDVEETAARPTPDGEYLVYIRDAFVEGDLRFAIFRMRTDGTDITQLTPWELNADRPVPSPARGGATAGWMAFETYGGASPGRGDIVMIPWDCEGVEDCMAQLRYVTRNNGGPASSFTATWSPDGQFLAYAEDVALGGDVQVWTSRWDGALREQITSGTPSAFPSWAS